MVGRDPPTSKPAYDPGRRSAHPRGGLQVAGSLQGATYCATYNATTRTLQDSLKTPKNLSTGDYPITAKVFAPDLSGAVNTNTVEVYIRR